METLESTEFRGTSVIYSNRPPTAGASGGAQEVIAASNPTWWVGPQSVSKAIWKDMSPALRGARTLYGDQYADEKSGYDVQTFPVPEKYADPQYLLISNAVLWPLAHEKQPTINLPLEKIEEAYWGGYVPHNELANNALHSMVDEYGLTNHDRVWVHDYQCDNVPGTLYTRHIPWPSVEFLETVTFKTEDRKEAVSIFDTEFFRDMLELSSSRILSTFQRPIDQVNFLMTAAMMTKNTRKFPDQFQLTYGNPVLKNISKDIHNPKKREAIRAALLDEIKIGDTTELMLFGSKTTVMNIPVGQVTENTYTHAIENEHRLNKTRFKFDKEHNYFSVFHADIGDGQTVNLTSVDENRHSEQYPPLLSDFMAPLKGRKIVLSVHRNDYTKGTTTKLEAAEKLLEERPETQEDTTFLFMLQPTREDVTGYREYAQQVFKQAARIREKYGPNSVVIIPEGVKHDDILGLMRQPEIRGFLALGHKDGHDLTAREIVDANDNDRAIGNVTSAGIGASDVLGEDHKGSFVIQNPKDASEVAEALRHILDDANSAMLQERFNWMKQRSKRYDANNFAREVDAAYAKALRYHFDTPEIQEQFMTALGDQYIDRKGSRVPASTETPDYIEATLQGNLILKDAGMLRKQRRSLGRQSLK